MKRTRSTHQGLVNKASFFSGAEETSSAFQMPEDISSLSTEQLVELRTAATAEFDSIYGDGSSLSTDDLARLNVLTDAITTLAGQIETLATVKAEAASLAAKRAEFGMAEVVADDEPEGDEPEDEEPAGEYATRTEIRVKPGTGQAARHAAAAATMAAEKMGQGVEAVVFATGEGLGVAKGTGMDFLALGTALDTRLKGFNLTQYQSAAASGRSVRDAQAFAAIKLPIADDLIVKSADRTHVEGVLARAVAGGNSADGRQALLASGGWFAPSEVLYTEFLELESTDGVLTAPEIGITRGGAQITPGTSFADIYAAVGFSYTEAEDIAGEYDTDSGGAIVGPKPVYKVEAPEFTDYRLDISGLIIEAGLLAYRGYPEHFADVIRKSLVAHVHKMNAEFIGKLVTGSTAVTLPATQAGAAAPILTAVELQAEHIRATLRMQRGSVIEAKFPQWVFGLIRADLSRREGVDLISVTDARIRQWFSDRNIAAEFVYDWQPIETTAAGSFTSWPATVSFLLYPAGTWVKGRSEVLTIDTLYDSTLLQNNDFTALFTEEGWLAAKIGTESRYVTTSVDASGAVKLGVDIAHNGTAA
jgi:hypothetical protein